MRDVERRHHSSKRRRLVREKVLNNIMLNLEELKPHLMSVEKVCGQNTRYKAGMIKEMLCDPTVHWYQQCVTPVIMEFERLYAFFQSTGADQQDLEPELSPHQEALRARVHAADGPPRATSCVTSVTDSPKKWTLASRNILSTQQKFRSL